MNLLLIIQTVSRLFDTAHRSRTNGMGFQRVHGCKYRISRPRLIQPYKHPHHRQFLPQLLDPIYQVDRLTVDHPSHRQLSNLVIYVSQAHSPETCASSRQPMD